MSRVVDVKEMLVAKLREADVELQQLDHEVRRARREAVVAVILGVLAVALSLASWAWE